MSPTVRFTIIGMLRSRWVCGAVSMCTRPLATTKRLRGDYPVLYLFHGSGDNDATWVVLGRAHLILDNLLAQSKVKPMIVVMTDGHAALPQVTGGVTPNMISRNVEDFGRDLLQDVLPFVEVQLPREEGAHAASHRRTLHGRRAVADDRTEPSGPIRLGRRI